MIYGNDCDFPGVDFKHYSNSLDRDKIARVIVPAGKKPSKGWPVCYLLHPFCASRFSWLKWLGRYCKFLFEETAFVIPESGRRWFINDAKGYDYESYIIQDLVPKIESKFSSVSRENRIIGGFSMGGASATFIALRYLGIFKTVFSIAGAFHAAWRQGNPYAYLSDQFIMMPTESEHERVWGDKNSITRVTYNLKSILNLVNIAEVNNKIANFIIEVGYSDYPRMLSMNRKTHLYLIKRGINHSYSEYPGAHDWEYAVQALLRILKQII